MWLNNQRVKLGNFDCKRGEQLKKIGVVPFRVRRGSKVPWGDMFSLLQRYQQREGDCNVPNKYKEDGQPLGVWLSKQRHNKKKSKLDPERKAWLEKLGVVWSFK